MNEYEQAARDTKAGRLADAFEAAMRTYLPHLAPNRYAELAAVAGDDVWAILAHDAGVRKPSPTTLAWVTQKLAIRALAQPDPFDGLPE